MLSSTLDGETQRALDLLLALAQVEARQPAERVKVVAIERKVVELGETRSVRIKLWTVHSCK